jgi:hypothetical protein
VSRFLGVPRDQVESRRQALREMHSAGIAFFNAIGRSIVLGSVDGSAGNSTWFTDKAETCANVLDTILLHYQTVRKKGPEVGIPFDSLSPSTTAYANIQRMVAQHDSRLATILREKYEKEGLPVYGFEKEETERLPSKDKNPMIKSTQVYIAFSFGVIFIVALIVLAICFPDPTPFQYMVFRIVLALAAAGAGAIIPGFIEVNVPGWIRAGGAVAVFVIVFFYNPAMLVAPATDNDKAPVSPPTNQTSTEQQEEEKRLTQEFALLGTYADAGDTDNLERAFKGLIDRNYPAKSVRSQLMKTENATVFDKLKNSADSRILKYVQELGGY